MRVLSIDQFDTLTKKANQLPALQFLMSLYPGFSKEMLEALESSRSQNHQDLFALSSAEFKRDGFFVEFGATNGLNLSNTHLLEKEFDWRGILAEPAKSYQAELRANRPRAIIEELCVWKDSNDILVFNETSNRDLSTIDRFSDLDEHRDSRKSGQKYEVGTISLQDLLLKHGAPKFIDYLSIDTEGSEFEILSAFDFTSYTFGVITCEHNYTPARERIFELLTSHGYIRKFPELSLFDDWYVKVA